MKVFGLKELFWKVASLILVLPVVMVVILLSPIILIRFRSLDSQRIGNYFGEVHRYLAEVEAGLHPKRRFDVFFHQSRICNHFLERIFLKRIFIFPIHQCFWYLDKIMRLFDKFSDKSPFVVKSVEAHSQILTNSLRTQQISFSSEEKIMATHELKKWSVSSVEKCICLYGRDPAYLRKKFPKVDWSYHDIRDSEINKYSKAASWLVDEGYTVFRMGQIVQEPLKVKNNNIIDYATSEHKSDVLDVYLPANCHFFLGVLGGLVSIPMFFNRPLVCVDVVNIWNLYNWDHTHGLFIFKKFWEPAAKRFLTFREILHSRTSQHELAKAVRTGELEIIGNTAEEIQDVAAEMELRLSGKWEETEEDRWLQKQFRQLYGESVLSDTRDIRVGAKYLRQNQELLNTKIAVNR